MKFSSYTYKTQALGPKHKFKKSMGSLNSGNKSSFGSSLKLATSQAELKRHNFNKTARASNAEFTTPKVACLIQEDLENISQELPLSEMLKEFNSKQEHVMQCMKVYNKEASKNKFQLKNTLKLLDENRVLREKYHDNLQAQQNHELTELKNTVIKKRLDAQEILNKRTNLLEKRQQILNLNQEKIEDVSKIKEKIKNAKKELEEILERKRDQN